MNQKIASLYIVFDRVASDFHGPVMKVKVEAQAVRAFTDIATDPQTIVHRHLADYELRQLGHIYVDDDGAKDHDQGYTLVDDHRVVLRGDTLKATLTQEPR